MLGAAFLWYSLVAEALRKIDSYAQPRLPDCKAIVTCEKIAQSISSKSQVLYPDSTQFNFDVSHWADSSSEVPVCSIEPGTPGDVATILQQISRAGVPFAVKGGHATNPGNPTFSSTPGVYVSIAQFNDTLPTYNRAYVNDVPTLHYANPIMEVFANEIKFCGDRLSQYDDSLLIAYIHEPSESGLRTHGEQSAHPPERSLTVLPSNSYFAWTNASADEFMAEAMHLSIKSLFEAGTQDGQDLKNIAPYVNDALFGTPLKVMYSGHLGRLSGIKKKYGS